MDGFEFKGSSVNELFIRNGFVSFGVIWKRKKMEFMFNVAVKVDLCAWRFASQCDRQILMLWRFFNEGIGRYQLVSLAKPLASPVGIDLFRVLFDPVEQSLLISGSLLPRFEELPERGGEFGIQVGAGVVEIPAAFKKRDRARMPGGEPALVPAVLQLPGVSVVLQLPG